MKVIKDILHNIDEELEAAEHYAEHALDLKSDYKNLADTYINISITELEHVNILLDIINKMVVRMQDTFTDDDKEDEEKEEHKYINLIFEWEHKKILKKIKEIKIIHQMYKS